MRKQNYPISIGLLLVFFTPATAADKPPAFTRADLAAAATLRERALADTTAYQLVESLTTEVGPRPAGSAGRQGSGGLGPARNAAAGIRKRAYRRGHRSSLGSRRSRILGARALSADHAHAGAGWQHRHGQRRYRSRCRDGQGSRGAGRAARGAVKDKIVFFSNRMERTRDGSGYGKAVRGSCCRPIRRRGAGRRRRRDPLRSAPATRGFRIPARPDTPSPHRAFPRWRYPIRTRTRWSGNSKAASPCGCGSGAARATFRRCARPTWSAKFRAPISPTKS